MTQKKVTKKVHGEMRAARQAKAERKRQTQSGENGREQVLDQVPPEPAVANGREHTIAKSMPPRTTKTAEVPAETIATTPPTTTAATPEDAGELVVFAFRLSRAERDRIHAAAGSAKASRFVRELAVAAARRDEASVMGILDRVQQKAWRRPVRNRSPSGP